MYVSLWAYTKCMGALSTQMRVLDTLERDLQVSGWDFLNMSAGDQTQVPWEQWLLLTMEPFVQPPLIFFFNLRLVLYFFIASLSFKWVSRGLHLYLFKVSLVLYKLGSVTCAWRLPPATMCYYFKRPLPVDSQRAERKSIVLRPSASPYTGTSWEGDISCSGSSEALTETSRWSWRMPFTGKVLTSEDAQGI